MVVADIDEESARPPRELVIDEHENALDCKSVAKATQVRLDATTRAIDPLPESAGGRRVGGWTGPGGVGECGDPGPPGGFQAAVVGEAAVEFEDEHAVDEGERGPGAFGAAGGPDQGGGGAVLQPGRQLFAGQRSFGHEPVQLGMAFGERAVGGDQSGQRFGGAVGGGVEGRGRLLEAGGDECGFEGGLVGQVLVQRRRADAEPVGEASHGQRLGAFGFQQFPGGRHDLPGARAQRLTHAVRGRAARPGA